MHGDNKQVVDKINNNLKNSLMITASLQTLSAVGIGGLLATTMDVTGILAASTIGLFSFFLLPMQRNQTKQGLFTHSLTYSLTHLLTYALTHLLTYSLTYLLTYSLTHSLTYSLTHSIRIFESYQHFTIATSYRCD